MNTKIVCIIITKNLPFFYTQNLHISDKSCAYLQSNRKKMGQLQGFSKKSFHIVDKQEKYAVHRNRLPRLGQPVHRGQVTLCVRASKPFLDVYAWMQRGCDYRQQPQPLQSQSHPQPQPMGAVDVPRIPLPLEQHQIRMIAKIMIIHQ